jgi:hypothetical protein
MRFEVNGQEWHAHFYHYNRHTTDGRPYAANRGTSCTLHPGACPADDARDRLFPTRENGSMCGAPDSTTAFSSLRELRLEQAARIDRTGAVRIISVERHGNFDRSVGRKIAFTKVLWMLFPAPGRNTDDKTTRGAFWRSYFEQLRPKEVL